MKSRRACIAALSLLLVGAVSAAAQRVRLRVTSDTEDTPVPRALVVLLNDREVWRTDDDGILVAEALHPGANVFTIRHIGLAPITTTLDVPARGTLAVHVIMRPAPQVLDTVAVAARATEPVLSAFDQRRLYSVGGQFITWADIQVKRPRETLDLFRNVLGVQVIMVNGTPTIASTRGLGVAGASCRPLVGFDGMVLTAGFDLNDIGPDEIYGIEIYSGSATIPAQYLASAAGSKCGLIMIWTVDGARRRAKGG